MKNITTIITESSKAKLPKCTWIQVDQLPALLDKNGNPLPTSVIILLIQLQAKHKNIRACLEVLEILEFIPREGNAPFATALLEGFLKSEQAAADRWAMSLAGLLGNHSIIPPLLSRIQGWCDNARCKLAEYAAQTISLLPGNEPLMVLDTLANRYRTRFKNVGNSCAQAFQDAATARGISPAELGDMVVPTFEFDEDGLRIFSWDGGKIGGELGSDLKISWFDPDSEKSYKTLPASVPDSIKDDVKLLGKLLRETIKGQTARLEMALVFQRKWTVTRWRELYETHPVLSCFASALVWGIYSTNNTLLRTFRRYHNGILADATGKEEELLESNTSIGMVHPLELSPADIATWQAHLNRLKVKQLFPQMERSVELLDPQWGNRTQIGITRDKKISAGTFRSRAEKRGWQRGSVADAGSITSYYKSYPGADIEVILPTDSFYIGIDPMSTIELSSACFVKSNTVTRGSYRYDDIVENDPRMIAFSQIPAVVYSETISDLKAITATKE